MNIIAISAFSDNYIWILHNEQEAIVVDPGEAEPVIKVLEQHQLKLAAILLTHHHSDHIGGVKALRQYLLEPYQNNVFAPANDGIAEPAQPLNASSQLNLLGLAIKVFDVPGHTLGHIAYYIAKQPLEHGGFCEPCLFPGDTLFSAGCGRLFEGSPAQMLASLDALAALPQETKVYSAHEYTLSNLRFAQTVEPINEAIAAHVQHCKELRMQGLPTLPSSIEVELRINPFLRSRTDDVIKSVQQRNPAAKDEVALFAALRSWKDQFK